MSLSLSLGLSLGGQGGGASGYTFTNAEAAAYVAAMSVQPNDTRKALIDTYVGALKSAAIWVDLDILYLFAAHDVQAARLNLKSPGSFSCIDSAGAPTFLTDRYFVGNGSTDLLSTQWTPSTQAVKYTLNDASAWIWVLNDVSAAVADMGMLGGGNRIRIVSRAGGNVQFAINCGTGSNVGTIATSAGMTGAQRTGAAASRAFRNGAQIGSDSVVASVALPTAPAQALGATAEFSTRQLAFLAVGAALTGKEVAFYNATLAYLQGVGALP